MIGGLPIAAGDILLKKYRVERLIGEGGTGIVISATHVQLEQRVAIKFLRRALESDELRTRFEREARAMGQIESDHIVLVLDAGALDDGAPYMVMEYLDGRDLARVLKEDGPLPFEQAVDCMLQVCEALQQAHDTGIVHRDLKPANLFLTRQPDNHVHVKVVDFGISKILDKKILDQSKAHEVTSAFTVLGSPRYMAPEQVRNSKDVDHRADLWSVGAVLFQLITGKHAFDAESNVQASVAVLTADPRKMSDFKDNLPEGLEEIVRRCLTRDVAKRFQTATELADALRPFCSQRAKDSLERIQAVNDGSSLRIAVDASSTSQPPPNPYALPTGSRDATTERKLRAAGPLPPPPPSAARNVAASMSESDRHMIINPSDIPGLPAGLPGPRNEAAPVSSPSTNGAGKIVLGVLALAAFMVILGGVVVIKRATHTGHSSPASRQAAPGSVVLLDAGKTSP